MIAPRSARYCAIFVRILTIVVGIAVLGGGCRTPIATDIPVMGNTDAEAMKSAQRDSLNFAPPLAQGPAAGRVVVDVGSGAVAMTEGSRRFRRGQSAVVYVVNLNPFRYLYDVSVTSVGIASKDAEVAGILLKLGGVTLETPVKKDANTTAVPGPADPSGVVLDSEEVARLSNSALKGLLGIRPVMTSELPQVCTNSRVERREQELDAIMEGVYPILSVLESLEGQLAGWNRRAAEDSTVLVSSTSDAKMLWSTGSELVERSDVISKLLDEAGASAAGSTVELTRAAEELERAFAGVSVPPGCEELRARVAEATGQYRAVGLRAERALQVARGIPENAAKLGDIRSGIRRVISNPRSFWTQRTVGDFDSASVVTIAVKRTDLLRPERERERVSLGEEQLKFGSPRALALALGPGFLGGFPRREFVRQRAAVDNVPDAARISSGVLQAEPEPGDQEDPAIGEVVGVERETSVRVPPMAILHLRLLDDLGRYGTSVHLSLGTNIGTLLDDVREWLPGISLGLRDERMFITAGPYIGPKRALSGNLTIGNVVPESIGELPTTIETKIGWGLAFSYRVQ